MPKHLVLYEILSNSKKIKGNVALNKHVQLRTFSGASHGKNNIYSWFSHSSKNYAFAYIKNSVAALI